MTEILTESYCERCGARFTFESPATAGGTFTRARVLARGLRNYLTSDESLDDALAEARRERDRQASGIQLQAFHDTFSFCFTCRQYTCRDCWNEAAGRCRTCAPMPGVPDPLDVRGLEAELIRLEEPVEPEARVAERLEPLTVDVLAWPSAEPASAAQPVLPRAGERIVAPEDEAIEPIEATAAPGIEVALERVTPADVPPEAAAAVAPELAEAAPELVGPPEPAPEEVASERAALAAVAALEPATVVPESPAEPEPEPLPAPAPQPEETAAEHAAEPFPTPAPEPEPIAAPEPAAAEPAAQPRPERGVVAAAPAQIPEPTRPPQVPVRQPRPPAPGPTPWQVVAPDELPPAVPGRSGAPPTDDAARRQAGWLARRRENPQPQVSARITRNVWEESTRDLVTHTGSGIQACQGCGLPLSATARFCRRCGSRQG